MINELLISFVVISIWLITIFVPNTMNNVVQNNISLSAYCGGLWLAALRCMVEIATILELDENIERYMTMLSKGKEAYERKLWNGMNRIILLLCHTIFRFINLIYNFFHVINHNNHHLFDVFCV